MQKENIAIFFIHRHHQLLRFPTSAPAEVCIFVMSSRKCVYCKVNSAVGPIEGKTRARLRNNNTGGDPLVLSPSDTVLHN